MQVSDERTSDGECEGKKGARAAYPGRTRRRVVGLAGAVLLQHLAQPGKLGGTFGGLLRPVARAARTPLHRCSPDARSRRRSRRPRPRSRRCRPTSARVGCCSRRGCCAFADVSPEEPSSDRVVSPASDFDGDRVVQRRGAAAPRSTSSSARKSASRNSASRRSVLL